MSTVAISTPSAPASARRSALWKSLFVQVLAALLLAVSALALSVLQRPALARAHVLTQLDEQVADDARDQAAGDTE